MQTVTPWSATAQDDIENSIILFEKELAGYTYRVHNTEDSLWIVAGYRSEARMAFRAAFAMSGPLEVQNLAQEDDTVTVMLNSKLGKFYVQIRFPSGMLHYHTTFTPDKPLLIPFWPRDIMPLTKSGSSENTFGKIHMQQVDSRSGMLFASMTKPDAGSLFYFQNLTSLSAYCQATKTTISETVGGSWPDIGFQLPLTCDDPLPAGTAVIISDAYVLLNPQHMDNDAAVTEHFLTSLGRIYKELPKPEIKYHDWPQTARQAMEDLYHNKGAWTQTNGIPYLNAYLCDYDTPAESMVQLAVLVPLSEYQKWCGKKQPLYDDLVSGLSAFYDPKINCINRWLPELCADLDESEEQKKEMVMDSWYLHHPLLNLSRLALQGDKIAEKLVLDSIEFVIKVAHHFKYEWPVFYNMETLEVIKKETSPGEGGENDVAGSYAHLMLELYRLTREKRYLNEAEKAALKYGEKGADLFYQANNTAFAAGAMLELHKITGKPIYLQTSYACLAGLFKNIQLYDCQYGFGKNYPNFFSIFPLSDAPYTAAYEEMEVYAALTEYLVQSKEVDILPALRVLIPEFIKYAVNRIPYYYPSMLPEDMISEEVKTGEVMRGLHVPLEDLYTGWECSGQVGQEVYGAGIAFGIVPRQYVKITDDYMVFVDYPISQCSKKGKSFTIRLDGDPDLTCQLKIIKVSSIKYPMSVSQHNEILKPYKKAVKIQQYEISGKGAVKIEW